MLRVLLTSRAVSLLMPRDFDSGLATVGSHMSLLWGGCPETRPSSERRGCGWLVCGGDGDAGKPEGCSSLHRL